MINNIEHFGGIFGKGDKNDDKKMTEDRLRLLNLNCKNVNGQDYSFDLIKKNV